MRNPFVLLSKILSLGWAWYGMVCEPVAQEQSRSRGERRVSCSEKSTYTSHTTVGMSLMRRRSMHEKLIYKLHTLVWKVNEKQGAKTRGLFKREIKKHVSKKSPPCAKWCKTL